MSYVTESFPPPPPLLCEATRERDEARRVESTCKSNMAAVHDRLEYDASEAEMMLKLSWGIICGDAGFKNSEEVVRVSVFVNTRRINSILVPARFAEEFHRRAQVDALRAFEWLDDPLLQVQKLRSLVPTMAHVEVKGSVTPTKWLNHGDLTVLFSFSRSDRRRV